MTGLFADDRAVSRLVSYTLTIAIAMALITGLLFAGSQLVEEQREQTLRSQLTVVGHQVAGSIEAADRLVRTSSNIPAEIGADRIRQLNVTRRTPERVVGTYYRIDITGEAVVVTDSREDVSVRVPYQNGTAVAESRVYGGQIVVTFNTEDDELVVKNV